MCLSHILKKNKSLVSPATVKARFANMFKSYVSSGSRFVLMYNFTLIIQQDLSSFVSSWRYCFKVGERVTAEGDTRGLNPKAYLHGCRTSIRWSSLICFYDCEVSPDEGQQPCSLFLYTNVSEEDVTSIFGPEDGGSTAKILHCVTTQKNVLAGWFALLFRMREVPGLYLDLETRCFNWRFRGFPQFLRTNSVTVPRIRLRLLTCTFFRIHCLFVRISFDAAQSQLLAASLNKLWINKRVAMKATNTIESWGLQSGPVPGTWKTFEWLSDCTSQKRSSSCGSGRLAPVQGVLRRPTSSV